MLSEYSALDSKLEVHYFFSDESHSMDATILNRCDFELLGIIRELAAVLSLEITVETEPIAEGGLKKWFKILHKGEDKKAPITTTVFTVILTIIITASLGKTLEKLVEKVFEDTVMSDLQKEKLKQEINVLKQY